MEFWTQKEAAYSEAVGAFKFFPKKLLGAINRAIN